MISKPTGLLRTASLAAAVLLVGCGSATTLQSGAGGNGGAGGIGAGGSAGGNGALVDAACGVGPMNIVFGDCPEPEPVPGCPTMPAGAYTSLVFITFCKFLGGTGDCPSGGKDPSKYWLGSCPSHNALSIKSTAYVSGGPGKTIAEAKLEVAINSAPGGAFEVTWTAQELDVPTLEPLGPPFGGKHSLPSICCKVVWDIYFPKGDYTYRLKAMTDWDTSVK